MKNNVDLKIEFDNPYKTKYYKNVSKRWVRIC